MSEWLDLPDLVDKTQDLIELGLYDDAWELVDTYRVVYRNEPELYVLYSRLHSGRGKPEKALPCLHRGLRLDRDNVDCLLGLFYCHSQLGQQKRAGRYLLRAGRTHGDNELVISELVWYFNENNRLDDALEQFEKACALGQSSPDLYQNAAVTFQRLGRFDEAEDCLKAALETSPELNEARDMLADLFIMRGSTDKAIALYRDRLKQSPSNVRSLSRLVFCLCQDGRLDEASNEARRTISLYPNSPVGHVDLAYVYLNMRRFDEALEAASRALDVSPLDAEAYRVRGIIASERGRPDMAGAAFQKALSLEPNNAEIIRDYYHHLKNEGEYETMEKLVQQVIRREYPSCMEDLWFLADFHRSEGRNLRAFHYLHRAYSLMPGEAELIPPMLEILLSHGHTWFSMLFLKRYLENKGWNEIVDRLSRHKRLRQARTQEGLRLLRFFNERPGEFRLHLFVYYLIRFAKTAVLIPLALVAVLLPLFFGLRGVLIALATLSIIAALVGGFVFFRRRKERVFSIP